MPINTTIDCDLYFKPIHNKLSFLYAKAFNNIYSGTIACIVSSISLALFTSSALAQGSTPTALSETFSDWQVNCQTLTISENKVQRYCQMSQQQVDEKSGSLVLLFTVDAVNPETNKTAINIIVPFGVSLTAGIAVIVNDTEISSGSYKTCLPQGCIANIQLEKDQIAHLLASDEAKIRMEILNSDKAVTVPLRLNGFQQAKTRLDALSSS